MYHEASGEHELPSPEHYVLKEVTSKTSPGTKADITEDALMAEPLLVK